MNNIFDWHSPKFTWCTPNGKWSASSDRKLMTFVISLFLFHLYSHWLWISISRTQRNRKYGKYISNEFKTTCGRVQCQLSVCGISVFVRLASCVLSLWSNFSIGWLLMPNWLLELSNVLCHFQTALKCHLSNSQNNNLISIKPHQRSIWASGVKDQTHLKCSKHECEMFIVC